MTTGIGFTTIAGARDNFCDTKGYYPRKLILSPQLLIKLREDARRGGYRGFGHLKGGKICGMMIIESLAIRAFDLR